MKIERGPAQLVKPDKPSSGELIVPLSSADLVFPRVHIDILYAFKAPAPPTQILREGLSRTLSHYPHFAGRPSTTESGRPAIVLNDAGVVLVEAQADGPLDDLWPFKPSRLLLHFIPPYSKGTPELFLVQITRFTCGGVTIGIAWDHQVADGEATCHFMNVWGVIVSGLSIPIKPIHDRSFFMPKDLPQPSLDHIKYNELPPNSNHDYPSLAIERLCFNRDLLKKIKDEAIKGAPKGIMYSTFVSLLAHLWRCITKARGLQYEEDESMVRFAVNVRKRINPPLPEGYFGNAMCHVCPHATMKQLVNEPLSFAASLIHNSIKNVNNDYVRSTYDFIEIQQKNHIQVPQKHSTPLTPNLRVTSWVALPLYELDFGRGTPMFAGNPIVPCEGFLILTQSPERDGSIDVRLGLFSPTMEKLESICFDI